MLPQQYCLRWRYHHSNLQTMFSQLLDRQAFCDVTLACEGKTIKAHKIVLSACSTYFETILSQYEEKDPILIMKDVTYIDIKCLVEFMYRGEINVEHNHLATLLKTAEELRIKGLAEVSWRDEEQPHQGHPHPDEGTSASNGMHTVIPQVAAVMGSPNYEPPPPPPPPQPKKKKRGRPPIGKTYDYDMQFMPPKISHVSGNVAVVDDGYSNSNSGHELQIWEEDAGQNTDEEPPPMKIKKETTHAELDEEEEEEDEEDEEGSDASFTTDKGGGGGGGTAKGSGAGNVTTSGVQSFLTPAIEKEWPDVVKLNDYLNTGRRQQFWEEPFTKRVMDAIKTRALEMKVAAELLGVSYGTLYGRYRDSYGCLKHPYSFHPIFNRRYAPIVRDFWTEQGPTDVLLKLKRKEITLFRAAEQLNVTPQTLSNYLMSMSHMEVTESNSGGACSGKEGSSDEETDSILPDSKRPVRPDLTIVKKEKPDNSNNNSDHSESGPRPPM
ncbi:protein tramtrack, beta isoform isoform X2 [Anthonomus grandis grandis]|uniref:protein tramtrack, beta isoform isoform X2 n=1 Tax=Anthonomus grandis grandis TaxID=2921223 RepID=UPI002166934C|nr:protein tramtrack, beta isoform isoform X2 [Anthonomus grandis grandis]